MEKLPNWRGGDRQVTINAIVKYAREEGFCNSQIAYILATVQHETAGTFQPVREGLNASDAWRKANLEYYPYYGRGYVQLTWESNYKKYSSLVGVNLVAKPDFALRADISMFVLLHGMKYGTFTGRTLNYYTRENRTDFYNARRVVNGLDKAFLIEGYAEQWLEKIV